MEKRILIIDDEENMRHMLTALLNESGFIVDSVADGALGLQKIEEVQYNYIFCDIRMPNMDGMTFLKTAADKLENSNVIMMSAYGSIDTAVEAMKLGAYDYISKPFQTDEVLLTIRKADERERLKHENIILKEQIKEIAEKSSFGNMIAKSKAMKSVFKLAEKVAQYDTTVLITGASGTGKELIARGLHYGGNRNKKPFIPVNCGGIPEALLESELFGHKKGAFTGANKNYIGLFEAANNGTIFLDEVGDLPFVLQVKLLRVLQENEVRPVGDTQTRMIDVRVIAATSKNLEQEVENGNFREDLFYRLNVLLIRLPPLIERSEDIPLLCEFFIDRFNEKLGKKISGVTPSAISLLLQHNWPGNVRELENVIERAVVLAEEDMLVQDNLPHKFLHDKKQCHQLEEIFNGFSIKVGKAILEKNLIQRALEATEGNRTKAAKLLEISHPSLLSKMKLYNILL
jgi:two-component system, NtrC family, response regulator AtoC